MRYIILPVLLFVITSTQAQIPPDSIRLKPFDSIPHVPAPVPVPADTTLRIINFSPFFSLHVDSSLKYTFLINKDQKKYYWYLKEAPAGFKLDKDDGTITFRSNKSLFLSGRLKYDREYPVRFGVQNLSNPVDKIDTTLRVTFYSTDIIYPRIKPTVVSPVTINEGMKLSFNVLCEPGNFPIEKVLLSSDVSIGKYKLPKTCDDTFEWTPPFDFASDKDPNKEKAVTLLFVGSTNFNFSDTARVKVIVKDGLDFDIANAEYHTVDSSMRRWLRTLKITFVQLDKRIRKTKGTRSVFEITAASSAASGTVITSIDKEKAVGKILPGVGALLVPVREASAPLKTAEQNQATLLRSNIKRLDYILADNQQSGDRDPLIISKTNTLRTELRQSQIQLIDVPTEVYDDMTDKQLDSYINSRKVQKKYRLR